MSSNHIEDIITFDYQEGETEQGLSYVIDIWNFRGKLEAAKVGDVATTNKFFVSDKEFSIELYIGGVDDDSKDHLGLFIINDSDEMVRARCEVFVCQTDGQKISVCEGRTEIYKSRFAAKEERTHGWARCAALTSCVLWSLLTGHLTLSVNLEVLDLHQRERKESLLQVEIYDLKAQLVDLKTELFNLKTELYDGEVPISSVKCPICKGLVKNQEVSPCQLLVKFLLIIFFCQGDVFCMDCFLSLTNNEIERDNKKPAQCGIL